jgi:hypothetical protein
MAPSPSNKNKPTKKSNVRKTKKPTQPPVDTKKKKTSVIPLFALGGCLVVGFLVAVCFCSLAFGGSGGGSEKTLNVFGAGISDPKPPSELPATMLSGICASSALCFMGAIAIVVLTRQKKTNDKVLLEMSAKLNDALLKLVQANEKYAKRLARAMREPDNKWVKDPYTVPVYDTVKMMVILGKVLKIFKGPNCVEEAKVFCNADPNGTHIQHYVNPKNREDTCAAVKTLTIMPESMGKNSDTVDTLTMKAGEGYHPHFSTIIHPRFLLLNLVTDLRVSNDGKTDLGITDIESSQKASQKQKDLWNEKCWLGLSGTCKYNSGGKHIKNAFLGIFFLIVDVLTLGLSLVPGIILGAVAVGIELAPDMVRDAQSAKEVEALSKRMEGLKNKIMMSNIYIGGKESYYGLLERIQLPGCTFFDQDHLKYKIWGTRKVGVYYQTGRGQQARGGPPKPEWDPNPVVSAMKERMRRYEALPHDFWNCDETTQILKFSERVECCNDPPGCGVRAEQKESCSRQVRYKQYEQQCNDENAKYTF